jgi:regulator of protease activity HflC (stomatin/prohibitin superfamily)
MAKSSYTAENEERIAVQRSTANKLVRYGIAMVIALVLTFICTKVRTVQGHELGVKETWKEGVIAQVLQPQTYFLVPGFSQEIYTYDASSQVFVMNDKPHHEEKGEGREKDAYKVQSSEGQDMTISMNLRWRIDPAKLVMIHKTVRKSIEEKLIRPVLMRVVKDEATKMKATEAYSGEGLVRLQSNIQNALAGQGEGKELAERGVIVENFVIESIELDPNYISEIKKKQIATQQQLRAVEEQKAAEAEALVAKSKAQAGLNEAVVRAEQEKQVGILKAQMTFSNQVMSAEGQKQQMILEAEGTKQSQIAKAEGVIAMGKAEAEAQKLKLSAYAVPGADAFVRVEVAKQLAEGTKGIQGYLPADIKVNTLSENFVKAVETFMSGPRPRPITVISAEK